MSRDKEIAETQRDFVTVPQLRIRHLMALTAVAAVMFSVIVHTTRNEASGPGAVAIKIALAITGSICLTGSAILLMAKDASPDGKYRSGHYVLLLQAVAWLVAGCIWFWFLDRPHRVGPNPPAGFLMMLGGTLVIADVLLFVSFARRYPSALPAVGLLVLSAGLFCSFLAGLPVSLFAVGRMAYKGSLADSPQKPTQADWLHWLGYATLAIHVSVLWALAANV